MRNNNCTEKAEFIYLPDAGHMIRYRESKLLREILTKENDSEQVK